VVFTLVSNMSIEVTSVNMDFIGRVVILLGEGMKKFLNFFFTRTYVYTSDMEWAH